MIDTESKSNTDLSIDNESNHSHSSENINNEIINEAIQANELSIGIAIEDSHDNATVDSSNVSHAYRTLLVHESNRLKAENGRLLRKVEKMRCIRSSMQDIFEQLQSNDAYVDEM